MRPHSTTTRDRSGTVTVSHASITPEQAHEIKMEELRLRRTQIESSDKERERAARLRLLEIEERIQARVIEERNRIAEANRVHEEGKRAFIEGIMKLLK